VRRPTPSFRRRSTHNRSRGRGQRRVGRGVDEGIRPRARRLRCLGSRGQGRRSPSAPGRRDHALPAVGGDCKVGRAASDGLISDAVSEFSAPTRCSRSSRVQQGRRRATDRCRPPLTITTLRHSQWWRTIDKCRALARSSPPPACRRTRDGADGAGNAPAASTGGTGIPERSDTSLTTQGLSAFRGVGHDRRPVAADCTSSRGRLSSSWKRDASAKDDELMAKDQDLDLFGAVRMTRAPSSSGVWSTPGRSAAAHRPITPGSAGQSSRPAEVSRVSCTHTLVLPKVAALARPPTWSPTPVQPSRAGYTVLMRPREFALMSRHRGCWVR
jgi:hypothetical protein